MSYATLIAMSQSQSLIQRVAACAASLGNKNPQQWAANNILPLVATADASLSSTWESAASNPNANPDTGGRTDVITDAMILSAVTARKNAQVQANDTTQGWA